MIMFEFIENDLEKEILSRNYDINYKNYFNEEQLWKIIKDCVSGLAFLQSKKINNTEIFP